MALQSSEVRFSSVALAARKTLIPLSKHTGVSPFGGGATHRRSRRKDRLPQLETWWQVIEAPGILRLAVALGLFRRALWSLDVLFGCESFGLEKGLDHGK